MGGKVCAVLKDESESRAKSKRSRTAVMLRGAGPLSWMFAQSMETTGQR